MKKHSDDRKRHIQADSVSDKSKDRIEKPVEPVSLFKKDHPKRDEFVISSNKRTHDETISENKSSDYSVNIPLANEEHYISVNRFITGITGKNGFVNPVSFRRKGSFKTYALTAILAAGVGVGGTVATVKYFNPVKEYVASSYNAIQTARAEKEVEEAKKLLESKGIKVNDSVQSIDDAVIVKDSTGKDVSSKIEVDTTGYNAEIPNEKLDKANSKEIIKEYMNSGDTTIISKYKDVLDEGKVSSAYAYLVKNGNFQGANKLHRAFGKKIPLNVGVYTAAVDKYSEDENFCKFVLVNHSHGKDFIYKHSDLSEQSAELLEQRCNKYKPIR